MNADALKSWNEAQKRLWESLSTSLPAFHPPEGMEAWRETYLHNLAAWEAAVKETLDMQAQWIRQWAERVGGERNTPEAVAEWTHQVEEVMQHWVHTQNQLWDNWFQMLRNGGAQSGVSRPDAKSANPPTAHPRPVVGESKPVAPAKPAPAQAPEPPKASAAASAPKPKTPRKSAPRKSAPRKTSTAKSKAAAQEPPTKPAPVKATSEPAKAQPAANPPRDAPTADQGPSAEPAGKQE